MKKFLLLIIILSISACNNVVKEPQDVKLNMYDGEPDGPHTSIEWKIWAFSTAAPSFIAANCTVIDSDGKTILREGTNGWTAMPGNPRGMSDPENGWMYMLHGDMGEDNTKHLVFNKEDAAVGHWIESGPHIMLMPKDPASLRGQTSDFNSGGPYIMFEGTGYDHIMIPVEGYYDYQPKK